MAWHGILEMDLFLAPARAGEPLRTIGHERHSGPLRVLKRQTPESLQRPHLTLLHPPGGLVGGDRLDLTVRLGAGAQGLITTPGAARYYRSEAAVAVQAVDLDLEEAAQLEWLPMEALAYPGCRAQNQLTLRLGLEARMLGWDVLALGLPAADQRFDHGQVSQSLHWPGVWREEGCISGQDSALCQGPTGLAGHSCVGTLWLAHGSGWPDDQREQLLERARQALASPAHATLLAGATAPDARLILVRALADQVEPVMQALRAVRLACRPLALGAGAHEPRLWRM